MAGVGAGVAAESTEEATAGRGGRGHVVESVTPMTFFGSEPLNAELKIMQKSH